MNAAPIRVVVADAAAELRELVRLQLDRQRFDVVGEAGTAEAVVTSVLELLPDVLVVDAALGAPGPGPLIGRILRAVPATKVVVLTGIGRAGSGAERDAVNAGAHATLAKELLANPAALAALLDRVTEPSGTTTPSSGSVRPSEERYRLLIDSVRDYAIFMLDVDGVVSSWNGGAQGIKGWTADEIIGTHFSAFYTSDAVAARHPDHELEIAARDGRYEEQGWRIRKDGTRFWANVVITPMHDDDGRLFGFADVTRDLSQPRAEDERLRRSEQRFQLLIDSVRDYAIFMLDVDGVVSSWNAGAQRIKGWTADEIIGTHFSAFYTADAVAARHPDHELEIAVRDGRYEEEGWRIRKDGTRFWANVVITPLRHEDGRLFGFAKVTRDMTERRAADEALGRAHADLVTRAAELERTNRELQAFASVAGHDLATPLQVIGGFTTLLRTRAADQLDEQAVGHLERIANATERAQGVLHDLLTYARAGGAGTAPQVAVDLEPVIDGVLGLLQPTLDAAGATVVVHDLPTVAGDASQLAQLFENLLGNAAKYTRPDRPPLIDVSAVRRGDGWEVSVADNGVGMPPDERADAFVMFRRLPGGADKPGTGIGLAICKKIVDAHRGSIRVEESASGGTDVRVVLPAVGRSAGRSDGDEGRSDGDESDQTASSTQTFLR